MLKASNEVLLHCCCAPCASAIIEWMLAHDVRPTLYYFNPNIFPEEEYLIRKNEITRYAAMLGLEIIDDDYDHASWRCCVKGMEQEPERGTRCLQCFKMRLLQTARKAAQLGFEVFATTLASSRWKSLTQINEAGRWAVEQVQKETGKSLRFDDRNWRKGGLQQRRNELLKENGFYNQLYCGCEFSLDAMRRKEKMIHLPEVRSTNTWMLDALTKEDTLLDETVVYTMRQTAGRGQMGNSWESEPDKNIAFSMLLCPEFLPIKEQFVISQLCSLAIVEALDALIEDQGLHTEDLHLSIKWPNDIYAGDRKLGGILIENRLMGSILQHSVLGVGLNVNQGKWIGNAPNPVSLKLLGVETSPMHVLNSVTRRIGELYQELKSNKDIASEIHARYMDRLYRKVGYYPYYDPERDEHFDAEIVGVDKQGPLILQLVSGEERSYWFKEVKFVLPCGITKE
ncbi:MAG: biotin--[acetyl-CoA-carboxylase] ligase [Bacteroidales bacterium]|nr:biotin--[acetyl-CoA-carboxylase] ligase [Bacteroidales bacterium]